MKLPPRLILIGPQGSGKSTLTRWFYENGGAFFDEVAFDPMTLSQRTLTNLLTRRDPVVIECSLPIDLWPEQCRALLEGATVIELKGAK